jgi:GH15 family glucan-1,4-alpha-glucosidase
MDLFSAARSFSHPFRFDPANRHDPLPIAARGLIGDGFSCALVRVDGAIDWMCLPRFDSPSVFAGLLDPARGGHTSVSPASATFDSLQQYDPDTNVLETLFRIPGEGTARLTDFMPWMDDPRAAIHEVHRRIECREGCVELEVVFDPRFGYGAHATHIEMHEHGVLARGAGGERLSAALGHRAHWTPREAGGVHTRVSLRAGEQCWLVLSWAAQRPEAIARYRSFEHLRATRHAWREWSRKLRYDGPWRHHVLRAALALKLLIYARTGGIVAAPTTSLPEWLGGARNWDYRFTWTRDAALAIRAANLIGYDREAREFFHFVSETLDRSHELQVMYAVDGEPVAAERELDHLGGYRGSRPVRIGNDARNQVQLDTAGALLDAAYLHEHFGGTLRLATWRHLRSVAEAVGKRWTRPDHGIWEPRNGVRHNVHSKLMSWLALQRGQPLALLFGEPALHDAWGHEAERIAQDLTRNGMDRDRRHFVSAYGHEDPDATLLLLPIHGFLQPSDPRALATIHWVREQLSDGPYVYRYLHEDGVGGREGAFVLCGFWLAEALALAGRLDEAQDVFVAHAESSNHLGLLPEEIDPATREPLGNFPQAFSHLGLINAACRIDLGLRLRNEGSSKRPRLVSEAAWGLPRLPG